MTWIVAVFGLVGVMGFAVAPGAAVAQIAKNVAAKSPWGPADEIGTLNMMTDASRLDVLKQVAGGKVYDLGVDLFVGMPICCAPFGDPTFQIFMTHTRPRTPPRSCCPTPAMASPCTRIPAPTSTPSITSGCTGRSGIRSAPQDALGVGDGPSPARTNILRSLPEGCSSMWRSPRMWSLAEPPIPSRWRTCRMR